MIEVATAPQWGRARTELSGSARR